MWRRMTTGLALTTLMGLGLFTWLWEAPVPLQEIALATVLLSSE
jgi:hypothetical protein